ncbi:MAG: response regulator [Bdellovibrionales bacterium]|nr:response regulator [Bdellovibrionales bacterium]
MNRRLKILVVDDDADIRKWVETTLSQFGHRIALAHNVLSAIEILRTDGFDMIISDLRMDGDDGIDLLAHVRRINWTSPKFVLFTSHADLPHEMALDLGANDVLAKPCSERELVDCVMSTFKDIHSQGEGGSEEREKKIRVRVALDADLMIEGDPVARVAKVLNVAKGGMFLCLEHSQPEVNSLVSLKVRFPVGTPGVSAGFVFQVRGLVRWSRQMADKGQPSGFGVQFLDLKPYDSEFLNKLVESERHQKVPALDGGAANKKIA